MKKRFGAMLLVVVMMLAGCGKGTEPVSGPDGITPTESSMPTEAIEKETETSAPVSTKVPEKDKEVSEKPDEVTTPTEAPVKAEEAVTPMVTPAETPEKTEEVDVTVTNSLHEIQNNEKTVFGRRHDALDTVNAYAGEVSLPYYVGRDNTEAVNYLKQNKTPSDGCLYLGMPMYLPAKMTSDVVYAEVSDTSVAKIEGNELIGLKQGKFVLRTYDASKNLLEEKNYYCTTYNDSKDKKESLLSFSGSLSDYTNVREITYWKTAIKTIQDMCFCLEARNFLYDFSKEPEMGCIWNVSELEEHWTWTPAAETIYEMSGGVCIQVAQLAAYMLAEDYEDWGAILIEGNQGHIFNWFYEDGYYYLFDFTQVISENHAYMDSRNFFRDYSKYVVKCQSIEEIKEYCTTKKVDLSQNYTIYMYSCHGYDFLPCNVNTGMSDSNAVLNNTWDGDHIKIRFQDIVMEDMVVLWENPESTPIVWDGVELDRVSKDIPYVYGREEYIYRHGY